MTTYKEKGLAAALAIQGHHAGLQHASKDALKTMNPAKWSEQDHDNLRLSEANVNTLLQRLVDDGLSIPDTAALPTSLYGGFSPPHAGAMLDIRMLFSALVDADFIETEAHFDGHPDGTKGYRGLGLPLRPDQAFLHLQSYLKELAAQSTAAASVNRLRADLLQSCTEAAGLAPGVFTLTSPTGTGKTLAMLAFALRHAADHHLR
ncbi:MAG: CRISPR-associated helicase/endonuclease Cas3, partial [Chloroflexi bacterium]|nr:CRISPR-associated helicase/endonuclease Cas3 [Chloroflexota bacterium]